MLCRAVSMTLRIALTEGPGSPNESFTWFGSACRVFGDGDTGGGEEDKLLVDIYEQWLEPVGEPAGSQG